MVSVNCLKKNNNNNNGNTMVHTKSAGIHINCNRILHINEAGGYDSIYRSIYRIYSLLRFIFDYMYMLKNCLHISYKIYIVLQCMFSLTSLLQRDCF